VPGVPISWVPTTKLSRCVGWEKLTPPPSLWSAHWHEPSGECGQCAVEHTGSGCERMILSTSTRHTIGSMVQWQRHWVYQRRYYMFGPVSIQMGDCLQVGIPCRYVTSQLGQLSLIPYGMWVPIALRLVTNCYTPFTLLHKQHPFHIHYLTSLHGQHKTILQTTATAACQYCSTTSDGNSDVVFPERCYYTKGMLCVFA